MIELLKKHITLILLIALFGFQSNNVSSQTYNNEWISLTQQYYRFSIPKTGMYRVTKTELEDAGIPFANINSLRNIQLISNGKEIPCYIKNENTENLEYIEFYAEKNSGWFDLDMYSDPSYQVNPYFSMINDTAAVYFTWNNNFNNLRYELIQNQDFSGYTPIPFCIIDTVQQYINTNSGYYRNGPEPIDCEYNSGEGFFDTERLEINGTVTKTIGTPNAYTSGVNAEVNIAFVSISDTRYNINISGPQINTDTVFRQKQGIKYKQTINANALNSVNNFTFSSNPITGTTTSFIELSYISIKYPSYFSFNNQEQKQFSISSSTNYSYISIENFNGGSQSYLFDNTTSQRIIMLEDESTYKALVKPSAVNNNLYAINDNAFLKVAQIKKAPITNFASFSNKTIIISHPKLWEQAQEYATYRNAALINIEDLYDQFSYGIQKHPLAIRNFLNYVQDVWTTKPEHLLIIGKGIAAPMCRFNSTAYAENLVPPMGSPASDVLLSAKIQGSGIVSSIATGRISVITNQQTSEYLSKVQEFELNSPAEWMKRAIFFGGGQTEYEQTTFSNYLKNYEQTFTGALFGGSVSTFLKESSDPITISKTDSIAWLINDGVSLLTFFGHGNATGFDQNIDAPEAYKNAGKYPLMIANSCYSGNIFLSGQESQSETWVLIADRGSIGFLAVVYEGIASYLDYFSNEFFNQFTNKAYGESLGKSINNTRLYMADRSTSGYYKSTIQQFNLHGDPCIVLNSFPKPDLLMDSKNISFSPAILTTELDSLTLIITPLNIGMATDSSSVISINRTFSDGSVSDTVISLSNLYFSDTLYVKLPINQLKGLGANTFNIQLDSYNEIDELNETNNSASISTYISSTDVLPLIPYKFSLLNFNNPTLKIATGDPYAAEQTSVFEIDTSYLFNSPLKYTEQVTHKGGITEWNPQVSLTADNTYYWRTAKQDAQKSDLKWSSSSFAIDQTEEGWQQSDIGQINNNTLQNIIYNENNGLLEYDTRPKHLHVQTYGTSALTSYNNIAFNIDSKGDYGSCNGNRMIVVIIDSITLEIWESDKDNFGHVNYPECTSRNRNDLYYCFANTTEGINSLINFVDNDVPDGNYILIYNAGNGNFPSWGEANYQGFESWYPNSRVRLQDAGNAYILLFAKGSNSFIYEQTANSTDPLSLDIDLYASFNSGYITTDKIGPSNKWNLISFTSNKSSIANEDSYILAYAIDNGGNEILLPDTLRSGTLDISNIPVQTYPYLKLKYHTYNPISVIPDQLNQWRVSYTPVSDIAINPMRGGEFYSDTLTQGEEGHYYIAYENIGYKNVDTINIRYWLIDNENKLNAVKTSTILPLAPGKFSFDSVNWSTIGLHSYNTIWVEIFSSTNKSTTNSNTEQYLFNNQAHRRFFVELDDTNPLLDVTFDGVHIMDGDIISSTPEVVIQLKDENQYLPLNDTSMFAVYLKSQKTGIEEKINLNGNPNITFVPAQLPKNKARLLYSASFPEDGVYELRVQAVDITGNESGANDYLISFEVINESSITNIFNYPNPFSTSTRFVFELTGSETPDEMRIDIITITGKIVKVIYLEDLEPLNIGRNITKYAWDGRDNFGDLLANGVYFYRVSAKLNGKELKIRNTGKEQFFKNGFGKMYLLR